MIQEFILSPIDKDDLITEITVSILSGMEEMLKEREKVNLDSKEWLTAKEVQQLWKISAVTLWDYDRKGITEPHKIGRRKRYRKDHILSCLKKIESKRG